MQRSRLLISLGISAAIVFGSWQFLTGSAHPVLAESVSSKVTASKGALDGMTFYGALSPGGSLETKDTFVFANGTFVSKECEVRCKYPAAPYIVRKVGNRTEFVSETKCPYKDAKIVWRGTVDGDTVKGIATWTVKRWYWRVENNFEFAGKLVSQPTPVASMQ